MRRIVGESGSGKSTLGRAMTRLLPNVEIRGTVGSVRFCGDDVLRCHPKRCRLRAIAVCRWCSRIRFPISIRRFASTGSWRRRAASWRSARRSAKVGGAFCSRSARRYARILRLYPHELSGGMRQRVLIGDGSGADPQILVAMSRDRARRTVSTGDPDAAPAQQRAHLAMLIITHDLGMVAELCDRSTSCMAARSSSGRRVHAVRRAAECLYAAFSRRHGVISKSGSRGAMSRSFGLRRKSFGGRSWLDGAANARRAVRRQPRAREKAGV